MVAFTIRLEYHKKSMEGFKTNKPEVWDVVQKEWSTSPTARYLQLIE